MRSLYFFVLTNDVDLTVSCQGPVVLGKLVSLGKIGIIIYFLIESALWLDSAIEGKTSEGSSSRASLLILGRAPGTRDRRDTCFDSVHLPVDLGSHRKAWLRYSAALYFKTNNCFIFHSLFTPFHSDDIFMPKDNNRASLPREPRTWSPTSVPDSSAMRGICNEGWPVTFAGKVREEAS